MGKSLGADFTTKGEEGRYGRVQLSESEAQEYDPIALVAVAANNGAWLLSNGACDKNDLEKALKTGHGFKKATFHFSGGIWNQESRVKPLKLWQTNTANFMSPILCSRGWHLIRCFLAQSAGLTPISNQVCDNLNYLYKIYYDIS